jgi:hypothetical protein
MVLLSFIMAQKNRPVIVALVASQSCLDLVPNVRGAMLAPLIRIALVTLLTTPPVTWVLNFSFAHVSIKKPHSL